jgi:hypothetical protein
MMYGPVINTGLSLARALALGLTPLPPQPQRCITYQEKPLKRWHTLCPDGTRAIYRWNPVLEHWDSTITPPSPHRLKEPPGR